MHMLSSSITQNTVSEWHVESTLLTDDNERIGGYNEETGEIFILGGATDGTYFASYNIFNKSFSTLPPLNIAVRAGGQGYTQFSNNIYFIHNHTLSQFNMDSKTIHYISSHPMNVYGKRTCVTVSEDGSYLFILGGSKSKSKYQKNKVSWFSVYEMDTDTLSNGPNMTIVRSSHTCQVYNDVLYAIGGDNKDGTLDSIEWIDVRDISQIQNKQWEMIPSRMTSVRNTLRSVIYNGYIYIIGGSKNDEYPLNLVERLDIDSHILYVDSAVPVETNAPLIVSTMSHIYAIIGNNIYSSNSASNSSATNNDSNHQTVSSEHPTVSSEHPTSILVSEGQSSEYMDSNEIYTILLLVILVCLCTISITILCKDKFKNGARIYRVRSHPGPFQREANQDIHNNNAEDDLENRIPGLGSLEENQANICEDHNMKDAPNHSENDHQKRSSLYKNEGVVNEEDGLGETTTSADPIYS